MKKTLIVQGGGFRTGFTAGVLDAFMALDYHPFDHVIGNSGGAISASYYLSKQYGSCLKAMHLLAGDPDFVKLKHAIQERGYMNIDYLRSVANELVPFSVESGEIALENNKVHFVTTNRATGLPEYLSPTGKDWIEIVIASSTLPFVTKGVHQVRGMDLMDGGWGDPIPVQWAVDQGSSNFIIIRTSHINRKVSQTWPDYLGSIYYRSNKELSECFAKNHTIYNDTMDFLSAPPDHVSIEQIWPEESLKCSSYSYSLEGINSDYRYGLQVGIDFVRKQENL